MNSHAMGYKGTGGRTIDAILCHGVPDIKRVQPNYIFLYILYILMVRGNEKLECKL